MTLPDPAPSSNRLYRELAAFWPLLSPPEDAAGEADLIRQVLQARGVAPAAADRRPALLELGSGAGHLLVHLTRDFSAVAVDQAEPMLAHSRRLLRGRDVQHVQGDMQSLRLDQVFDAVLATDALDYLTTEADLAAACRTAAAHLEPGGIFLAAANYLRETFADHQAAEDQRTVDGTELRLLSFVHDPDPADTTFQFVTLLLVHHEGRLRVIDDRHTCGLFPLATWLRLLDEADFDTELLRIEDADTFYTYPDPRGLSPEELSEGLIWFVGTKR